MNKQQIDEEVHLRNEYLIYIFEKCFRITLSKNHSKYDTHTFFFFHCFKVWVKFCVTCTLNWKQNIDFSLSRVSTGAFPPPASSCRMYTRIRFEALHTRDKHSIPLQDKVLNSTHTKSSAGQPGKARKNSIRSSCPHLCLLCTRVTTVLVRETRTVSLKETLAECLEH